MRRGLTVSPPVFAAGCPSNLLSRVSGPRPRQSCCGYVGKRCFWFLSELCCALKRTAGPRTGRRRHHHRVTSARWPGSTQRQARPAGWGRLGQRMAPWGLHVSRWDASASLLLQAVTFFPPFFCLFSLRSPPQSFHCHCFIPNQTSFVWTLTFKGAVSSFS